MSRKSAKKRHAARIFWGSQRRSGRGIDADAKLLAERGELVDPELRGVVALLRDDGIHVLQELVVHVLYTSEIDFEGQRAHQVNRLIETVKRIFPRLDRQVIGHAAEAPGESVAEPGLVPLDFFAGGGVEQGLDALEVEFVGHELFAQRGIEDELGGKMQHLREGRAHATEKTHEGSVVLVNSSVSRFGFGHGGAQKLADNLLPFVAEERLEGIGGATEVAIKETKHGGKVGGQKGLAQFANDGTEFDLARVEPDAGHEVVVAKVKHAEADILLLAGHAGPNTASADGETGASGFEPHVVDLFDLVAGGE